VKSIPHWFGIENSIPFLIFSLLISVKFTILLKPILSFMEAKILYKIMGTYFFQIRSKTYYKFMENGIF
jgi:hypothetical protein